MDKDRTRGERRDQHRRHIRRVRRIEHRAHRGAPRDCRCAARPDGRYRKANAFACRCRAKAKGAPKLGGGMCRTPGDYRTTLVRRVWNKRLAQGWRCAADLDGCDLPSGPITGRRRSARVW